MTKAILYLLIKLATAYQAGEAPLVIQEGVPWLIDRAPIGHTFDTRDCEIHVGLNTLDVIEDGEFSISVRIRF